MVTATIMELQHTAAECPPQEWETVYESVSC